MKLSYLPFAIILLLSSCNTGAAKPPGFCYSEINGPNTDGAWDCLGKVYEATMKQCERDPKGSCWVPKKGSTDGRDARTGGCYSKVDSDGKTCLGPLITTKTVTAFRCWCLSGKCLRRLDGTGTGTEEDVVIDRLPTARRRLQVTEENNCETPETCDECEAFTGGEPHLKTWSGEWFDYMGECDLVLLHAPQLYMDIHVRTKVRYAYSYITSVAIRIEDDLIEVAGWGDYYVNGVGRAEYESSKSMVAGYWFSWKKTPDSKSHEFDLALSDHDHIYLKTFKDWVSVRVSSHSIEKFGDSVGLLGNFFTGTKLPRNGTTEMIDVNEYGEEWQVRGDGTDPQIFQSVEGPQWPEQCRYPPTTTEKSRRLGASISRDAAAKACAGWGEAIEACITDVVKSGDIEMAEAGGY